MKKKERHWRQEKKLSKWNYVKSVKRISNTIWHNYTGHHTSSSSSSSASTSRWRSRSRRSKKIKRLFFGWSKLNSHHQHIFLLFLFCLLFNFLCLAFANVFSWHFFVIYFFGWHFFVIYFFPNLQSHNWNWI